MKALASGARIADRYVLESVIARGGMGAVYKAIDERLGRTVAIKVLLAELAEDDTSIERFEREASATARLTHPAVVQLYDFGKHEGLPYIVMEHVVGRTLAAELDQKRRIAPTRACDIIEQALGGIGAAHAAGIVHRDLKPGNIMLVPTGTGREVVKVLDFGIAQLKESPTYHRLTKTGAVLGTPTFMSPEQTRGETCDPRADIYAMGVVLWCCLTGQRPFVGPDVPTTLGKVLSEMPPRADKIDPSISAAIAHATERAMEKRPSARYASAAEFAEALSEARMQSGIPATATVSLPPERESEPPAVTREMPAMFPIGAPQPSIPSTSSPVPVASLAPPSSSSSGWRAWVAAFVALALLVGVVVGGVVVVGVFEYRADAARASAAPPALAVPIAPLLPSLVPGNPIQAAPVCEQLHVCCNHIRATVRPDFPDCDAFVGQLQGDPDLCAQRLVMFQQMAGSPIPPECIGR